MVFDFTTIVRALGGDPAAFEGLDVTNLAPDAAEGTRY